MADKSTSKTKVRFLTRVSYGYPHDHPENPAQNETTMLTGAPVTVPVNQSRVFEPGEEVDLHDVDVQELLKGDGNLIEIVDEGAQRKADKAAEAADKAKADAEAAQAEADQAEADKTAKAAEAAEKAKAGDDSKSKPA